MKIDMSKVNLLEKDIEDWLYGHPGVISLRYANDPITKWIGRQYNLPSGIADLIGMRDSGKLVVIEVKNVTINKAAILQVCRYADDLKHIVLHRANYTHVAADGDPQIEMVVVGPSIDSQTFTEAQAVGVRVFQFEVVLNVELSALCWTDDHRDLVRTEHLEIASRSEWDMYGPTAEDIADMERSPTFPDRQTPYSGNEIIAEHDQDEGEDIRF